MLYSQNGDRVVTIDSVTSFHSMCRLENENVDEKKYVVVRKTEKVVVVSGSRGLQKTELQDITAERREAPWRLAAL